MSGWPRRQQHGRNVARVRNSRAEPGRPDREWLRVVGEADDTVGMAGGGRVDAEHGREQVGGEDVEYRAGGHPVSGYSWDFWLSSRLVPHRHRARAELQ